MGVSDDESVGDRYVRYVSQLYTCERANLAGSSPAFVIVDRAFNQHSEAGEYLQSLRDRDVSPNTQRMYAIRIARFLTICQEQGVDWRALEWEFLRSYRDRLSREALRGGSQRMATTVNAHMRSVVDFCVFAAQMGWMSTDLIWQMQVRVNRSRVHPRADLSRPIPAQRSLASALKLREAKSRPRTIDYDDLGQAIDAAANARDRFLVLLLLQTGLRIGEALGLRRDDLHFLPDSRNMGCRLRGPHLHVIRRVNPNEALAKSRNERVVPVTAELVDFYVDMMFEKMEHVAVEQHSDMVFINTFREPLGEALTYSATRYVFEAISSRLGYRVSPHVLRHTCASHWLDHGTDRDVVQELLGHSVPKSTEIYLHPRTKRLREAVEATSWRLDRGLPR